MVFFLQESSEVKQPLNVIYSLSWKWFLGRHFGHQCFLYVWAEDPILCWRYRVCIGVRDGFNISGGFKYFLDLFVFFSVDVVSGFGPSFGVGASGMVVLHGVYPVTLGGCVLVIFSFFLLYFPFHCV